MYAPRFLGRLNCCSTTGECDAINDHSISASHRSAGIGSKRCRRTSAKVFVAAALVVCFATAAFSQRKRVPPGGNIAVVADERLGALRVAPTLTARLIRRLGRGTFVSIRGSRRNQGILFSHVAVTRRTAGWVQHEALVMSGRNGDDRRLAHLLSAADEFDRIARARLFLDTFPRSSLRPKVLLALGDAAEEAAAQLSKEAPRRFERREIPTDGAPEFSYYMNYNGLDRYNRQGVIFTFDRGTKQFHYDGAAWREIVRKYAGSPEAIEATKRLTAFAARADADTLRSQ